MRDPTLDDRLNALYGLLYAEGDAAPLESTESILKTQLVQVVHPLFGHMVTLTERLDGLFHTVHHSLGIRSTKVQHAFSRGTGQVALGRFMDSALNKLGGDKPTIAGMEMYYKGLRVRTNSLASFEKRVEVTMSKEAIIVRMSVPEGDYQIGGWVELWSASSARHFGEFRASELTEQIGLSLLDQIKA